jgi:hypothetical protein
MFRVLVVATWLGTLLACSEQGFSNNSSTKITPEPDIEVTPLSLDFGLVNSTGEEVRTFEISNVGDAQLEVSGIVIDGASFIMLTPDTELILEVGDVEELAVAFSPKQAYDNFGEAIISSDDPDEAEVVVDLFGEGAAPQLEITPATFDFGAVDIPCGEELTLTLENIGQEPLELSALGFKTSDGQFQLMDSNVLPLTLEQNETTTVDVTFEPVQPGSTTASVTAESNDPRGPQTASQTGEGAYLSLQDEQFVVPENPPVDILFAVDQSCSMDTITTPLATAFSDFISQLNTVTQGWNVGVVTNDDGCFNNGVLTATTANYQSLFTDAVSKGGCTEGHPSCDTEALLKLTNSALSKTYSGGCNDNFLRTGALLHVIVVSDEKERSGVGAYAYLQDYMAYTGSQSLTKVSGIVDINYDCGDGSGPGQYTDAANWSSGLLLDVCSSNWSGKTTDLALASLTNINEYPLTAVPDESSLEVAVDGVVWTADWHYDSATNSVVFDLEMTGGQVIDVSYGELSTCP